MASIADSAERDDQEEPSSLGSWAVVGLTAIFVFVVLAWVGTPFVLGALETEPDKRGQFGDQFGSINALFTGLAFAGLIVTVLLQRKELSLQRAELALTRTELKRSADAQNAAQVALNQTMYAQSFKVALDILEDEKVVSARYRLNELSRVHGTDPRNFNSHQRQAAQMVMRTFDAVGTMIKRGMLPAPYIVEAWSGSISHAWMLSRQHIEKLRTDRSDPTLGRDFEDLALMAATYLAEENDRVNAVKTSA